MSGKRQERESISVELGGKTYSGEMVVEGTRKLTFWVEYQGHRSPNDSRSWKPGSEERRNMRQLAHIHLLRLVEDVERIG